MATATMRGLDHRFEYVAVLLVSDSTETNLGNDELRVGQVVVVGVGKVDDDNDDMDGMIGCDGLVATIMAG